MPFAGYKDFADCVAKNQDKNDPDAYCAVIKRQVEGEGYRHPDFDKIYKQFLAYEDGENRYWNWISALNLDETKSYGYSFKEKFKWIQKHVDFNLWKEDRRNKYWQVEAGFPVESMNYNVYTEDELQESARTLAHKPTNLNHKFPLPTIDIPAARYEDGVVEAVLKVPKNLHCPICDKTKSINDLIESGGIVNVSLEASCTLKSDDPRKCEGMEFTGLSLLTKDVLPGIPLTRLMPLESIMVEALQSSTNRRKRKVKTIKMEVLEQDEETDEHGCVVGKQTWDAETEKCVSIPSMEQADPCPEGQKRNPETGECETKPPEEQITQVIPVDVPGDTATEPDEHGQCPEGKIINALGKCVPIKECGEDSHWDANANEGQGGCVPDTVPKPETPETAVGASPAPQEDVLTDAPLEQPTPEEQPPITGTDTIPVAMPAAGEQPGVTGAPAEPETPMTPTAPGEIEPKPPHTCPDGSHYDLDANICVPDTTLTERVRRFKAEDEAQKAKDKAYSKTVQMDRLNTRWEKRYTDLSTQFQQLLGGMKQQSKRVTDLESALTKTRNQRDEFRIETRQLKNDYADKDRDNKHLQHMTEDLKIENNKLKKKYHGALATNLELSRKNTKANEDYLTIARERDELRNKVKKARIHAKKTLKIKV